MRTVTPPAHRSLRKALADYLAPVALRTRPYTHVPLETDIADALDADVPVRPRARHG
jgi:hypothetical protein